MRQTEIPPHRDKAVCYHGDGSGRADRVAVEVGSAVVEVLGHVGEGFVAEATLVERVDGVSLPAGGQRRALSRAGRHDLAAGVRACCRASPVHNKSHLSGEATAAVHTQVPGHT